jgi:hypothetical protein
MERESSKNKEMVLDRKRRKRKKEKERERKRKTIIFHKCYKLLDSFLTTLRPFPFPVLFQHRRKANPGIPDDRATLFPGKASQIVRLRLRVLHSGQQKRLRAGMTDALVTLVLSHVFRHTVPVILFSYTCFCHSFFHVCLQAISLSRVS